jgi:hypothetical protein
MLKDGVEKELKRFTDYVVKEAKSNLTRLKKNSTKSLYDSLKGNVKVTSNSFEMSIEMEEYGHFQDKGVNGLKKNQNAPYSFKKGFPNRQMINSLDKWIMRKGIAPRGKDGKFISRKSLKFALARSIFNKGIKPSLFLTKPFEKAFKTLPDELIEKFGLEVFDLFDYTLQTPKK